MIADLDNPNTLFYLDPPYFPDTRVSKTVYDHEMSVADHLELLRCISRVKGKVAISGYDNEGYQCHLGNWNCQYYSMPNNAAGGKKKRIMTECLWMNY